MSEVVAGAYSGRAAEYVALLGEVGVAHPVDRQLIATWGEGVEGAIIDAGCGPGHWTGFLRNAGRVARGVDLVPEFIEHARASLPGVPFEVGSFEALDADDASVGGVLSWYSLIHHEPGGLQAPLREFHRVLAPGGSLLVGFFEGPEVERFDHAVTPAYRWPVDAMAEQLRTAGFDIAEEFVRRAAGERSHAASIARRPG